MRWPKECRKAAEQGPTRRLKVIHGTRGNLVRAPESVSCALGGILFFIGTAEKTKWHRCPKSMRVVWNEVFPAQTFDFRSQVNFRRYDTCILIAFTKEKLRKWMTGART
jgi:hypothetical protein